MRAGIPLAEREGYCDGMFAWLRNRRRRHWLNEPFPSEWDQILARHVKHATRMPADLVVRWRQHIQVFANATTWEGCRNFQVTDEVKVVIAANATLLTLGFENEWLDCVKHVLVHPAPYLGRRARLGIDGVDYSRRDWMQQLEDDVEDEHLGEAWFESGTVILVWSEVPTADHVTPPGQNVVLHEFAHVMHELQASWFPTARAENGELWLEAFQHEFERLSREAERGRRSLLDDYAAESPEEFFCVATECFFERPDRMQSQCPSLYRLCRQFYSLDPAIWGASAAEA